ncbi:MAG: class I SAM-dependent methyltransferase [Pseudomonadota bacterium]
MPPALEQRRCAGCGLHRFVPAMIGPASLYARLSDWAPYYSAGRWEWAVAIEVLVQAGVDSVLELGAGRGDFLNQARHAIARVEGLEFNPAAVAAARKVDLPVSDHALESVEPGQEAIVAFHVVEHLADPAAFFRAGAAKLAADGFLLVSLPNQDGFVGELVGNYLNLPPHHATLWRKSCFEVAAERFGLDFIDYRTEPINRAQYKLYLLRHARPAGRGAILHKCSNFARRLAVDALAPIAFELQRHGLAGESHLAVFRKAVAMNLDR